MNMKLPGKVVEECSRHSGKGCAKAMLMPFAATAMQPAAQPPDVLLSIGQRYQTQ